MNSRVFILGPSDYDLSKAESFGPLVNVFNGSRPSIFDHERFKSSFIRALKAHKFDVDKDYFLFIGTAVPSILTTSFIIAEYGYFNALLFNAAQQEYNVRTLGR